MKHISDNILTLGLSPHENQKCASRSALENQTRPFVSSVCCVENEDQIAGFVSQKASQLIHYAKDIRDILKQSEQKLYRNYSNAMESESLQECIHNFNQLSCAMKTDIVRMKEYLIPYSPGFKEDSPVFKFDNVPGSEDSMDEPMVEFLKGQNTKESAPSTELPNISDNVQHVADKTITIHLNEAKLNSTGIQNKSSSEFSNEEGTDKKSTSNLARKQKKKLRRRRKSDLKRQNSFDKGDDEMNLEGEHIVSTSDDELARTREPKQHKDPVFDTSSHVSLSDLVHLSDGSPVLESKFKLNSVTTEPGKVCVPTVRKIFTPVVDDCNGSPHVVGYVLRSAIEKETNEEPKVTEMSNKQNSDDVNSKCLDLNNSLEYIDKSDENDVDKVSNSSLKVESNDTLPPRDKEIQNYGKAEESLRMTENSKSDVKKHSSKDLTKQNETDKSENSKIKSIIEKYNKLTSVQNDEAVTTPIKTNKAPSNKIKELTEVFDTDASSKHSSQEISAPVQDENIPRSQKLEETPSDDSRTKDSIDLPKSAITRDSIPHNTSDTSLASEKLQSIPPHIPSEDYKNYRRHKTKLQLAKEEFLSNMACTSSHLDNINTVETVGTIAADPNHTDTTKPNPHVKPVQKSFSSGMINTLSNSYGKLNKEEATKSNDSHVKAKKKTKSFREKFSTFRLKFKKPKSDKNLLDVGDSCGLSLDTGINNGASDVSARTSTHSIASNCSKSSSWRRFFDR
ncbi:hypothetical protein M8J75_001212 [Diaphorina citri]|nr:hypothetical protein M8J75_001212 [Diaphorina citri]